MTASLPCLETTMQARPRRVETWSNMVQRSWRGPWPWVTKISGYCLPFGERNRDSAAQFDRPQRHINRH